LNPHLGRAPYFLFIDVDRGQIGNWFVRKNPGAELERKMGMATAKFLIEHNADVLLTKEIGEAPFHVLRDSFVKIYNSLMG
jgi:predicted Fe-Mo cluster-binding NifX family protein